MPREPRAAGASPGVRSATCSAARRLEAAWLITATIVAVAVIVVPSAMLSKRDPRSPFVRLMLVICIITGRRPRDYPPSAGGIADDGNLVTVPGGGVSRNRPIVRRCSNQAADAALVRQNSSKNFLDTPRSCETVSRR